MGLVDSFRYLNISYGQKKGWESNCQFHSRPLKVRNRFDLLMCRWHATYRWKALNSAITLLQTSPQLEVFTRSYCLPKSRKSQFGEFRNSQFGSCRKKWHLGASLVAKHKEYYKGEGGGFPQVWAVLSLVNLCLTVARPCTKSVPTMH
jgi:hypothetical protein